RVAAGRDIPFERQLEVGVAVFGDDVAGRGDPGELPIDHLPPGGHRIHLVAAPPGGGLPVEQQFPAGRLLGGAQGVVLRLSARARDDGEAANEEAELCAGHMRVGWDAVDYDSKPEAATLAGAMIRR